jgi:hypothetical protein
MGPLPIFTTNYDLCIEDIFSVAGESQRLITGLTGKDGPNVGFTEKEGFFGNEMVVMRQKKYRLCLT